MRLGKTGKKTKLSFLNSIAALMHNYSEGGYL